MKDGFDKSRLASGETAFLFKNSFAQNLSKPIFAVL